MGVYAKLDWYTVMLYNTSIGKIMRRLEIDTDLYEELLNSVYERSYGFVSHAVFGCHGINIEMKWDDYLGIVGDQSELTDDKRAGFFETEFLKLRLDISGAGLDYLRSVKPEIVSGFTDPAFWSKDPAMSKVTRSDFAFDFVNYKPGFVDKFIGWIQDAERSGQISARSSRLYTGGSRAVQYSYRGGDQKTLYLGSTRGDKLLRIYDKLLQYQKNGVIIKPLPDAFASEGTVTSWYRIELQTRRKSADEYLFGIEGDLSRVLRVLFEKYLVRGRDGQPLDFLVDLYKWEDLPPIIQNAKYEKTASVLDQATSYVTGQAFRSVFLCLLRFLLCVGCDMKQQLCFGKADILLPDFLADAEACRKWAVVACDQFTGEREYWEKAERIVGDAPSTLRMILPEAYLGGDNTARLAQIAKTMQRYRKDLLRRYPNALIYVRRTQSDGKVRRGIVGAVDLECYDYAVGSTSPIRATEGTVLERIPPRVAVRRAAVLEAPHVMLLIDDPADAVIGELEAQRDTLQKLYDFELMLGGGRLEGYLLTDAQADGALSRMRSCFAESKSGLQLAVGDGNHSLASAKARYAEIKAELGEEAARQHPLRYALCEVVNLHDDALEFEPIYRLVKTDAPKALLDALRAYGAACAPGTQTVECVLGGQHADIPLGAGTHSLTVGTLQRFLDDYISAHPDVTADYIHGRDTLLRLAAAPGYLGFLFDGMGKAALFPTVDRDGALPRKTFSMGHAEDKRYYMECRKIAK